MILPLGQIVDLALIEQIKHEGAKYQPETYDDLEIIPDIP